jgi:hypothetical protein
VAAISAATLIPAPINASGVLPATSGLAPPVTVSELPAIPKLKSRSAATGKFTTILLSSQSSSPFTLVGLTWIGPASPGTEFKVRVRESGEWTNWFKLEFGEYQGVGEDGSESLEARVGSDPLLTGLANGVEVIMENFSGVVPADLKVTLINSQVTQQDRNLAAQSSRASKNQIGFQAKSNTAFANTVVSPQGALVPRPRIVSREEWGADESWRESNPRMGTTVVAGIVHHTASTNNYTADQAPAQMRNLYAYFTKSLNYSDMGYNFLVDKFGTIYEGRDGCALVDSLTCDGPAMPSKGAHTAGFNQDTFGVSVIGNYDVLAPENPEAIVKSVSELVAWKIAPYGLDPNGTAKLLSTDTSGSSKYRAGQTAVTKVITAHRDVGYTVCPGRFFYPYMDEIRSKAATILTPAIRDLSISPSNLNQVSTENVNVRVTVPASAKWSIEIVNETTKSLVNARSGTQKVTGQINYTWDKTDQNGKPVPSGRYYILVKASHPTLRLPKVRRILTIASPPKILSKVAFTRISPIKTKVTWEARTSTIAPVTSNEFRISSDGKKTWSKWARASNSDLVISKWKLGKTYYIELRSSNRIGRSDVVQKKYVVLPYSPPKPEAVVELVISQSKPNSVTATWSAKGGDYESLGFRTRISINGDKWSAWTKTKNLVSYRVINTKPGDKVRIQVIEINLSGSSPTAIARYTAK